ncbi:hypothetical protein [Longimicrobium sp.]|uniref:hypothetical protein n=1 Tax=Longimicrobium sp. TaxID=2029185 RepID=UPI002C37AF85|nr:hypothetical protein [Longimicrobium sp.]HSU16893.1 hypothetical protein [Longimicrobium sp.]
MEKRIRLALEELAVTTFETESKDALQAHVISGAYPTCRTCPTINGTCCTP